MNQQFRRDFLQALAISAKLIEMRDPYTRGHSEKVSRWSEIVAQKLGLNEKEQEEINLAAKLHDIGKISIPDRILNKPGRSDIKQARPLKQRGIC